MKHLLVILFACMSGVLFGYSVEEIQELKRLGFSNEQIVEMAKAGKAPPGQPSAEPASPPPPPPASPEVAARMAKFRQGNAGLLVLCMAKEWGNRGPGYLHVDRSENGKWVPVGRLNVQKYFYDGRRLPPVYEPCKDGGKGHHRKIKIPARDLIVSRYYGEFDLPAGKYEIKVERSFNTGDKENISFMGQKRWRIFRAVDLRPGKASILTYQWRENANFGLDECVSDEHLRFVDQVAGQLNGFLNGVWGPKGY